jgi:hypothetical protein
MRPDYYETACDATAWYAVRDMPEEALVVARTDRGAPLVATRARWLATTAVLALGLVAAAWAYLVYTHADRTLASLAGLLACGVVAEGVVVLVALRAEESRLARELRTARTGTAVARGLVARRAARAPFLVRLLSTRVGVAAVLLADGDRDAAVDALARSSTLTRGGRLDALRAIVDADLERASGGPASLERCLELLHGVGPIGNREADLYRTHVRVKALLELGDAEGAVELIGELQKSSDDEQQIYVAWLRVWFDLDAEAAGYREAWPAIPEGQLRLATLLARAHGADKLVEKLEERVSSIAQPALRE